MGKHLNWKIKYNYVIRYINGESPTKLGLELKNLDFIDVNSNNSFAGSIYRYKK